MTAPAATYLPDWLNHFAKELAGEIIMSDDAGNTIQSYRTRYDISQQELAGLMGLRRESISRIENNSVAPTFDFLRRYVRLIAMVAAIRESIPGRREADTRHLESSSREFGFTRSELDTLTRIAFEGYENKVRKIRRALR